MKTNITNRLAPAPRSRRSERERRLRPAATARDILGRDPRLSVIATGRGQYVRLDHGHD
jgi:hypothetical protein